MRINLASRQGRLLASVGVTFMAVLGVAISVAPTASGKTNRRVCEYSNKYEPSNSVGETIGYSKWVMNYEKGEGCPTNKNGDTTYRGLAWPRSFAKVTCEDFAKDMNINGDPCLSMNKDEIYEVTSYTDGGSPEYISYGHYKGSDPE